MAKEKVKKIKLDPCDRCGEDVEMRPPFCSTCGNDAHGKCNNCYDAYCDDCFEDHLHEYFQLEPLNKDDTIRVCVDCDREEDDCECDIEGEDDASQEEEE